MTKVSIVLPVYNVEKYIGDCINSIISQTCRDFELVIVDDESPDKSIDIAESLLKRTDLKYRIIHRKNGGLSAARNTGIRASKGKYLCFVDSDDVINPQYVETLLFDVEKNNVQLAIANFKWVNDSNKKDYDLSIQHGTIVKKKKFLYQILQRKVFNYFGCFLISRSYILKKNLWFDESVFFGVDQAYMWKLMVCVPKYTYNSKVIYNYYNRPGSIMTSTKIEKMLSGLPSMKQCAAELKPNPYFDSSYIYTRWKISALHTISKSFSYEEFNKTIPKLDITLMDCLEYPHWKIKAIGLSKIFGNKVFYYIMRRF